MDLEHSEMQNQVGGGISQSMGLTRAQFIQQTDNYDLLQQYKSNKREKELSNLKRTHNSNFMVNQSHHLEEPLDEVESNLFLNINTKNRDIRQFLNTTHSSAGNFKDMLPNQISSYAMLNNSGVFNASQDFKTNISDQTHPMLLESSNKLPNSSFNPSLNQGLNDISGMMIHKYKDFKDFKDQREISQ